MEVKNALTVVHSTLSAPFVAGTTGTAAAANTDHDDDQNKYSDSNQNCHCSIIQKASGKYETRMKLRISDSFSKI